MNTTVAPGTYSGKYQPESSKKARSNAVMYDVPVVTPAIKFQLKMRCSQCDFAVPSPPPFSISAPSNVEHENCSLALLLIPSVTSFRVVTPKDVDSVIVEVDGVQLYL